MDGETLVEDLPKEAELILSPVAAQTFWLPLKIVSEEEENTLQLQVSTVVMVASLIEHLRQTFNLKDSGWKLYRDDKALNPYLLLDELQFTKNALVLKK